MPLRALNEGKKWMYQTFSKQPLPSLGLECWGVKVLKNTTNKRRNMKVHQQQEFFFEVLKVVTGGFAYGR